MGELTGLPRSLEEKTGGEEERETEGMDGKVKGKGRDEKRKGRGWKREEKGGRYPPSFTVWLRTWTTCRAMVVYLARGQTAEMMTLSKSLSSSPTV